MKRYSKLILVLVLVLSLTVLMIACGGEETPAADSSGQENSDVTPDVEEGGDTTTASDGNGSSLGGDGVPGDTVLFEDLMNGGAQTTGEGTDDATDDETTDHSSVTVVDGVMPDGGKVWGEIQTGRPVN